MNKYVERQFDFTSVLSKQLLIHLNFKYSEITGASFTLATFKGHETQLVWAVWWGLVRAWGGRAAPGGVCVLRYLRPVSGCINAGCAAGAAVATAGFGLLTFVLLLANSSRIVCGMSGSKRTPCCEQPRAARRSDIMKMEGSVAACCLLMCSNRGGGYSRFDRRSGRGYCIWISTANFARKI